MWTLPTAMRIRTRRQPTTGGSARDWHRHLKVPVAETSPGPLEI